MISSRSHPAYYPNPWIIADSGNIFYRRDWHINSSSNSNSNNNNNNRNSYTSTQSCSLDTFPTPHIGPRRSRPQAIHILSYPPGYIPPDLHPRPNNKSLSLGIRRKKKQHRSGRQQSPSQQPSSPQPACRRQSLSLRRLSKPPFLNLSSPTAAASSPQTLTSPLQDQGQGQGQGQVDSSTASSSQHSVSRAPSGASRSITPTPTPTPQTPSLAMPSRRAADTAAYRLPADVGFLPPRTQKSPFTSVTELPKPVASGSGLTCSILLAEQNVFLYGFDHDNQSSRQNHRSGTALLRGRLRLNVSKNVKIKAVQLKLLGRARTEWPEGIPPLKQTMFEEESLRTQVLTFFNAMNDGWENEYGNQCTFSLKSTSNNSSQANLATPTSPSHLHSHRTSLTPKEFKRLSLQHVQSRSFGKSDYGLASTTQTKGYKVFYPGIYDYSFELPIDYHQLETTKLQYGSVKWELQAIVDRAGAFKPNLRGVKPVPIIRLPDPMSQEMSEPISINRLWENQLHYDIVISGKSFPIGSRIPIAFKLTPLDKVHIHKIKVLLTESTEYWTNDKRVTRKDPGRKILLLEKVAGKPLDPHWRNSTVSTLCGGELSPTERQEARESARMRRVAEAVRRRVSPEPLPEPTDNILGELDLGLESMWGSTEMEAQVQIPTCEMMAKNKDLRLHPDCSWKNVNVYHWIKVVMRISRLDPTDPTGTKRRHFEISIDSPFTVLDCRATKANTYLPSYTGAAAPQQPDVYQATCGCPDAHVAATATDVSPTGSSMVLGGGLELGGDAMAADGAMDDMPATPRAAHLHQPTSSTEVMGGSGISSPTSAEAAHGQAIYDGSASSPRLIHLMRVPSFNPPSFDADTAPPPIVVDSDGEGNQATRSTMTADLPTMTPPPNYDTVMGTCAVDGLADYFARLADYGLENEEDDSDGETPPRILERSGRVNVLHPRTPGGRMPSRSMEISRPAISLLGGGGGEGLLAKYGKNKTNRSSLAT